MNEPTFRDFAMASMEGDGAKGVPLLEQLLGVDGASARAATDHFRAQMATGPEFMMKAMSMRTVVGAGDAAALAVLLGECFGLAPNAAARAADVVLARHAPPPA